MAADFTSVSTDLRSLNTSRAGVEDNKSRHVLYPSSRANIADHVNSGFVNSIPPGSAPMYIPRITPQPSATVAPVDSPNFVSRPAEPAGDEVPDDREPSTRKKVKFLCSFGGRILPRLSDGALRYVGGQTRIISVQRDIGFQHLMQKMVAICGRAAIMKYQLPDEDLDALVTVSCEEDLENMMEEYERLLESPLDGSPKLRVFLFSAVETDSPRFAQFIDLTDTGQRYVEAVNGVSEGPGGRRKESTASASSTHSEGPGSSGEAVDNLSSNPRVDDGVPCATVITSNDDAGLLDLGCNSAMPVNLPPILTAHPRAGSSSSRPEHEQGATSGFVKPYTDWQQMDYSHCPAQFFYASPRAVMLSGMPYQEGIIGVPPSHPMMQGHVFPAPSSPRTTLKANGGQQFIQRVETHSDGSSIGPAGVVPGLNDQNKLTPQAQQSGQKNVSSVEQYLLRPVPPPSAKIIKQDDFFVCHKPLTSAHSEILLQEHVSDLPKTISEPREVFQSHYSDVSAQTGESHKALTGPMIDVDTNLDARAKLGFPGAGTGQRYGGQVDLTTNEMLLPSHVGHLGATQFTGGQLMDNGELTHQFGFAHAHACPGYSMNRQACGFYASNYLPRHPSGDSSSIRSNVLQPQENSVWDSATNCAGQFTGFTPLEGFSESCFSSDKIRPILGKMEALDVQPLDATEYYRRHVHQHIARASKESTGEALPVGVEIRNQIIEQDPLPITSGPINPAAILNEACHRPVGPIPISPHTLPNLNTFQSAESCQTTSDIGNPSLSSKIKADVTPSTAGTSPCPSSAASTGNRMVEDNQVDASLSAPINSWDPRNNVQHVQQAHFPPPRPVKVPSKDNLVSRDSGSETCVSSNDGIKSGNGSESGTSTSKNLLAEPVKMSTDEQIKHDLKAVAEDVAASVLRTSVYSVPLQLAQEAKSPIIEFTQGREFQWSDGEGQKQDLKTKFMDKPNHLLNFTDNIGHLQIIKNSDLEELTELGSGTFGTVYHGKWRGTDVAIKRINDRCFAGKPSEQERLRADFWNEACKLADLHHPNVVAFYGVVLDGPGGSVATVTEYMVNGSLRNALQKHDRVLDRRKRLHIAMDVAFGMEYLHGKNIIHFDLKSDNLLVNLRDPHRPICKVGDLGLSKVKCQTLISGGVRGTLPWMAPELLNGSSILVSEKVDVFSFAIVMWELLTGEEPYVDLHYGAIIGGIVNNTLRPPVPAKCDTQWQWLMEKCWSAEPSDRPSFTEVACKLRSMAASFPSKGQCQPSNQPQFQK